MERDFGPEKVDQQRYSTGVLLINPPPLRSEIGQISPNFRGAFIAFQKLSEIFRGFLLLFRIFRPFKVPFFDHFPPENHPKIAKFFACGAFPPCIHPKNFRRASRAISSIYPCKTKVLDSKILKIFACGSQNPGDLAKF